MSLTPTENEPDHEPYDGLSKVYPPESLDWRDPYNKQASCDSVVNRTNAAITKYCPPESLDWRDLQDNKVEGCNDGVYTEDNEAVTLKKLPRLSELLDLRDLYGLKVTCDGAEKLGHPDWRLLNGKQVICEDSEVTQNIFNKTEMVLENRRLLKRENKSVDVRAESANDEDEITKSILRKYIKEASLKKTDVVVKDGDGQWTSLSRESKSFSQLALGIQTNQPIEDPSSPGLLSWLVGWCSFLWNKVGFLYTQKDSSLQTSNPTGSSKKSDSQSGQDGDPISIPRNIKESTFAAP